MHAAAMLPTYHTHQLNDSQSEKTAEPPAHRDALPKQGASSIHSHHNIPTRLSQPTYLCKPAVLQLIPPPVAATRLCHCKKARRCLANMPIDRNNPHIVHAWVLLSTLARIHTCMPRASLQVHMQTPTATAALQLLQPLQAAVDKTHPTLPAVGCCQP